MELVVAMTYGQALFDAAVELDRLDEIYEEIAQIDEIFLKEREYYGLLCNPAIPDSRKKMLVRNVFQGRISREVLSLLFILMDKDRMLHYSRIVREYNRLREEYMGYGTGIIYSSIPLNDDQIVKFEEEASKLLKKKVNLVNEIDKTIIGGIKILVDGKLIDASLRGRLEKLTGKLGISMKY